MRRLGHELKMRDAQREKLAGQLAAKERELGALENRVPSPVLAPCCPPRRLGSNDEQFMTMVADVQHASVPSQWASMT